MDRRQFFKLAGAAALATQLPNVPMKEDSLGAWLQCDGSELSATKYKALFQIMGTSYGGNKSKFKLPDLRGTTIKVKGVQYAGHYIKVRETTNDNKLVNNGTFIHPYPIGSIIHFI